MSVPAINLRKLVDEDWRLRAGVCCIACGESLAGAQLDGACPHCGAEVHPSLAKVIASQCNLLDADDRLCVDYACESCRYNLRMLRIGDHCPECNAVVAPRFARLGRTLTDPHWLTRVRRGARLLLVGIVLPWFAAPIAFAIALIPSSSSAPEMVATLLMIAALLLPLIALLYVTTPLPDRLTWTAGVDSVRMFTRLAAMGTLATFALAVLMVGLSWSLAAFASVPRPNALQFAAGPLMFIAWGAAGLAIAGFIAYVGSLRMLAAVSLKRDGWNMMARVAGVLYFTAPCFVGAALPMFAVAAFIVYAMFASAVFAAFALLNEPD